METQKYIKINPADSVVVCLSPMKKGETVAVDGIVITLLQDTPAGHKVLIKDTRAGEDIIKYGYPIGHATEDLVAGQWVNEHNLKTNLAGTLSYEYHPVPEVAEASQGSESRCSTTPPPSPQGCVSRCSTAPPPVVPTFMGYQRKNGEVGIRNEIWIVPTVGCVNGIA